MSDTNFESAFFERLLEIHEVTKESELAKVVGRSTSTVHNWKVRGNIPISECVDLARSKGVSLDWLILGKGVKYYGTADLGTPLAASAAPGPGLAPIKLYDVEGAAGAGRSLEAERVEGVLHFPQAQLTALGLDAERVAGIKVRGDSMENTLADGDWVLVNLADTDYRQEGVFLLLVSGERRIKRVQRLAGGALYLISDNEHYQPEMIPPQQMREVEILGRCEVRIGRIS